MTKLDVREQAERIVELFRSRQPIEILPAELYPAGDQFPFRGNVRRGLSVKVTGSKEAVDLLSTGPAR